MTDQLLNWLEMAWDRACTIHEVRLVVMIGLLWSIGIILFNQACEWRECRMAEKGQVGLPFGKFTTLLRILISAGPGICIAGILFSPWALLAAIALGLGITLVIHDWVYVRMLNLIAHCDRLEKRHRELLDHDYQLAVALTQADRKHRRYRRVTKKTIATLKTAFEAHIHMTYERVRKVHCDTKP